MWRRWWRAQDKTEIGRDSLTFRREDGVAENFDAAQNKICSKAFERYRTAIITRLLSEALAGRNRGFGSRHLRARQSGYLGYADLFLLVIADCAGGDGCCGENGESV